MALVDTGRERAVDVTTIESLIMSKLILPGDQPIEGAEPKVPSDGLLTTMIRRLLQWRYVFAEWQLGRTRPEVDPEGSAVRDHRQVTMLTRVELNAAMRALLTKGVITSDDFKIALAQEILKSEADHAKKFPGFKNTAEGVEFNKDVADLCKTCEGWKP